MMMIQGPAIGNHLFKALSSVQVMGSQSTEVQARILSVVSATEMQLGNRASAETMLDRSLRTNCEVSVLGSKVMLNFSNYFLVSNSRGVRMLQDFSGRRPLLPVSWSIRSPPPNTPTKP